jgi:hypothetical protein
MMLLASFLRIRELLGMAITCTCAKVSAHMYIFTNGHNGTVIFFNESKQGIGNHCLQGCDPVQSRKYLATFRLNVMYHIHGRRIIGV